MSPTQVPTHTPYSVVMPVGAHDVGAQRAWEHEQVALGVDRYRRSLVRVDDEGKTHARSLSDLEPGQVIAADLIGPLAERIGGAQQVALDDLKKLPKPSTFAWGLSLLPADTLAAITVLHALGRFQASPFTACAISLGTRVEHEWAYLRWKDAEAKAEKERKAAGDDGTPNLFKLMLHRNDGKANDRVFAKWAKKAPLFVPGKWASATKADIGSALLTLLIESNAWFEAKIECIHNRQVRIFKMTEVGLSFVSDRHSQNELLRPHLLPMICEPVDFEYLEVA